MLQHAFLFTGRFLLRDLVELALLQARADQATLAAARQRFADAPSAAWRGAWDLGLALASACLPRLVPKAARPGLGTRALAWRMLLQQRSPWLMQLLGPAGWILSRALGWAPGEPGSSASASWTARMVEHWLLFQRKTRW
jgi:hypothetical protein